MDAVKKKVPGVLICLIIAVPCWLLGKAVPVVGGPVFAILSGMIITLFWKRKDAAQPGIAYTSKKVLQYAVILLGFGLNLSEIAKVGATSLPIIASTIATSLVIAFVLYKLMKMPAIHLHFWWGWAPLSAAAPPSRPRPLSSGPMTRRSPNPCPSFSFLTCWPPCSSPRWGPPWG